MHSWAQPYRRGEHAGRADACVLPSKLSGSCGNASRYRRRRGPAVEPEGTPRDDHDDAAPRPACSLTPTPRPPGRRLGPADLGGDRRRSTRPGSTGWPTASPATAHDAEDLTQDVFVRVFRSLYSYTPGTFEGWLHRITTNLFLDKVRRKQRIRFDALADDAAARLPSRERRPGRSLRRHPLRRRRPARARRPAARLPGRGRALRHRGPLLRGDRRHARHQARHRPLPHPPRPRPAARGPRAPRPATRPGRRPPRARPGAGSASGGSRRGPGDGVRGGDRRTAVTWVAGQRVRRPRPAAPASCWPATSTWRCAARAAPRPRRSGACWSPCAARTTPCLPARCSPRCSAWRDRPSTCRLRGRTCRWSTPAAPALHRSPVRAAVLAGLAAGASGRRRARASGWPASARAADRGAELAGGAAARGRHDGPGAPAGRRARWSRSPRWGVVPAADVLSVASSPAAVQPPGAASLDRARAPAWHIPAMSEEPGAPGRARPAAAAGPRVHPAGATSGTPARCRRPPAGPPRRRRASPTRRRPAEPFAPRAGRGRRVATGTAPDTLRPAPSGQSARPRVRRPRGRAGPATAGTRASAARGAGEPGARP